MKKISLSTTLRGEKKRFLRAKGGGVRGSLTYRRLKRQLDGCGKRGKRIQL